MLLLVSIQNIPACRQTGKRLHLHGLIKKIKDTYKYYPTKLGRIVIATGLKLKELYIIPQPCLPAGRFAIKLFSLPLREVVKQSIR